MAVVETYTEDSLIAGNNIPVTVQTATVKSGEGELERGALLGRDSNNKMVFMTTAAVGASIDPECILAAAVDATDGAAVAEVYVTGEFNENALKKGTGVTITDAMKLALKKDGILLKKSVTN